MRKYFIICVSIVFLLTMALPAGADVSFYDRVYFFNYLEDITSPEATAGGQQTSDDNLIWELDQRSTRFGAKFKGDSVDANVENRAKASSYVRLWNATWKMGGGKSLRCGQAYSPL